MVKYLFWTAQSHAATTDYERNFKSTGTLRHACITQSTDYYQRLTLECWFTNLEQTGATESQSTVTGTVQTNYY